MVTSSEKSASGRLKETKVSDFGENLISDNRIMTDVVGIECEMVTILFVDILQLISEEQVLNLKMPKRLMNRLFNTNAYCDESWWPIGLLFTTKEATQPPLAL